jgi:hypothetical protein
MGDPRWCRAFQLEAKLKYFIDTEFIESGHKVPLILLSIALVAEDGREYYAENGEADRSASNRWVSENVIPFMMGPVLTRKQIAQDIIEFVSRDKPEFWGYFADYDWVLFCQLFGTMMDLPNGFPMWCRDIKQLAEFYGVMKDQFPEQKGIAHHALDDARWTRDVHTFITVRPDLE